MANEAAATAMETVAGEEFVPLSDEELVRAYWGDKLSQIFELVKPLPSLRVSEDIKTLPPLWLRIAVQSRFGIPHRDRVTIENHFLSVANQLGLGKSTPLVTPEMAKKIVNLKIVADDTQFLDEGVNPFNLLVRTEDLGCQYPNTGDVVLAEKIIQEYDATGKMPEYSLSVSDMRLVCDWKHTIRILEAQFIVLIAMLGNGHILVEKYEHFLNKFKANQNKYIDHLTNNVYMHCPYKYCHAIILRHVHQVLFDWLRPIVYGYRDSEILEATDIHFDRFLRDMDSGTYTYDYSVLPVPYQGWNWDNIFNNYRKTRRIFP